MPHHFLAACLFAFAVCAVIAFAPAALLAARALSGPGVILSLAVMLFVAAVLANAGADLW